MSETVEMLTSDGPPLLDQVRKALAAGDAAGAALHAHSIKGMVSNFCAVQAHAAAQRVEQLGKTGDLAAASAAVQPLNEELNALTRELLEFVKARA